MLSLRHPLPLYERGWGMVSMYANLHCMLRTLRNLGCSFPVALGNSLYSMGITPVMFVFRFVSVVLLCA